MYFSRSHKKIGALILTVLIVSSIFFGTAPSANAEINRANMNQPGAGKAAADEALGKGGGASPSTGGDKAGDVDKCMSGVIPSINIKACVEGFSAYIAYLVLTLISWLVGISGLLFNTVLTYTVVEMKRRVTEISAIQSGWVLFRDVGNLVFIFILLYIAIKTILSAEDPNTKKLVTNIIIIGLLINFSLFFTKFLIDGSNILATSFYNLITGTAEFSRQAFSERFTRPLGIESLFNPDLSKGMGLTGIITLGVGGSIFLLMVAFTFFYAAGLLIIRFVALIALMILSPLAFIFWILPSTKKYWEQWRDGLVGQLVFAPVYMLFMFIIFVYANGPTSKAGNLLGALLPNPRDINLGTVSGGAMTAALNFIILIALMNLAAVIATKISASSGGVIATAVNKVNNAIGYQTMQRRAIGAVKTTGSAATTATTGTAKAVGSTTLGLGGVALRRTVGKKAYEYSKDNTLIDKAAQGGLKGTMARARLGVYQGLSKSSFDARNTGLGKSLGIQPPKPAGQGGYKGYVDTVSKRVQEYANKTLGDGDMFVGTDGKTFSGGTMMAKAEKQAWEELGSGADINAIQDKTKEIYDDHVKTITALGVQKKSRKEVFAKQVLQKGNMAQRFYALTGLVSAVTGNKAAGDRSYQSTYLGHMEGAKQILSKVKKEGKKKGLPKMRAERSELRDKMRSLERIIDEGKERGRPLSADEITAKENELKNTKAQLLKKEEDIAEAEGVRREPEDGGKKDEAKDEGK
jgi:hypothetical protein